MTHFLLLHGSWHGAWCWHKIAPRLEAAGHRATAIDLPGRGRAPARAAWVSLGRMVRAAEAALPAEGKATIVVHSRGGIVASQLAERAPERIERTIYLASFMLPTGRRVLDYLPDRASAIARHIHVDRLAMRDRLDPALYRDGLYADCSEDDVALASALLVPEPVRPALTRLRLTPQRYGRVPRAYIRLGEDRAVSPALQDRLLEETPVERVAELRGSHSVYFSQPDRLTAAILELARPAR
jgi:pimeloyl-ACP methyl ester carboxylesterase